MKRILAASVLAFHAMCGHALADNGLPLVAFIHSLGGSNEQWSRQMDALRADQPCKAIGRRITQPMPTSVPS